MPIDVANRTIGDAFWIAADRYADKPFLIAPPSTGQMRTITYSEAADQVEAIAGKLSEAGYGCGDRIAVLMGNRLEHFLLMLAMNTLGISIVPVNPDYRPGEIAYLLQDSASRFVIAEASRADLATDGVRESGIACPLAVYEALEEAVFPERGGALAPSAVTPETEASLIYTSGTTGRPKGCRIGHEYSLMIGERYLTMGGKATIGEAVERVYNPLPLYHVNAMILSFFGILLSGNCQISPARFSKSAWWPDLEATGATIFHYLGIIIPALLADPPGPDDRRHGIRLGIGAGVEPELHGVFEDRFGMTLVEGWGMTEMCRIFAASEEPRQRDTRAFGRAGPGREARVVDEADRDVPAGMPGELVVRHSAETPRRGFFSGYLNREADTEDAWRGGWFHTGDTVVCDEAGMFYFVDRKKNVIRRSGENIAAAEVEDCLYSDQRVAQVAVIPVADPLRDEEVFACVVAKSGVTGDAAFARALFDICFSALAYYKAPGWLLFVDELPVTGTQKVLKHKIFPDGTDPTQQAGVHDFRDLKRR
ncbi:MAG: AMP-binding protein [Pseudomonadota bacterium]